MAHRNRVRRHRPDRRPRPPRPSGDLAPRPLVHRGASALGKRRDVRGRPEPSTHRQRSTRDGHAAEPGHQPAPPGRRHQHRQSPTASRPGHQVPDHTAADQLKCRTRTAPRTLPTPWVWSPPATVEPVHANLASLSCAGRTLCVAVDGYGNFLSLNGSTWTAPVKTRSETALPAVSCPSVTFCMALDRSGHSATFNGSAWAEPVLVSTLNPLSALSCSSSTFCVAVDEGGHAFKFEAGNWSGPTTIRQAGNLQSVVAIHLGASGLVPTHAGPRHRYSD